MRSVPPRGRDCVRTQIDHDQSNHYRTASVGAGCRHSTPALLSVSRNYIGFEVEWRHPVATLAVLYECFDPDQFEFSHSLYRTVVLTSWYRGLSYSVPFLHTFGS